MCELCNEAEDGVVGCQDCGRTICFDNPPSDFDVADCAYVTSSGDLFCRRCGKQYDEAEEEGYLDSEGFDASWLDDEDDGEDMGAFSQEMAEGCARAESPQRPSHAGSPPTSATA